MKTKSGFILRALGDNYIIVPVGPEAQRFNGIIKINETGKLIWEMLEGSSTEDQIIDAMTEQFDIGREQAEHDVKTFIEKAAKANLIDIDD